MFAIFASLGWECQFLIELQIYQFWILKQYDNNNFRYEFEPNELKILSCDLGLKMQNFTENVWVCQRFLLIIVFYFATPEFLQFLRANISFNITHRVQNVTDYLFSQVLSRSFVIVRVLWKNWLNFSKSSFPIRFSLLHIQPSLFLFV